MEKHIYFKPKKKITVLLSAVFLTTALLENTSNSEIHQKRTVAELLDLVLVSNSDLRVSKNQELQAEAKLEVSKSKFLPKISFSMNQLKQERNTFFSQEGITTKATAEWNLFNGFKDRFTFDQRKSEAEKSKMDSIATSFGQREKAISSLYQIISYQLDIENIEEKIKVEKEREIDLEKRVASRSARRSDLLSVQASLLSSLNDLQSTEKDFLSEWNKLNSLAGKELSPSEIAVPSKKLGKISPLLSPEAHPEVKAAELDLEAARYAVKNSLGQFLPSFDLSYNHYFGRPEIQKDNSWDVQLTASVGFPFDWEKISNLQQNKLAAFQKEIVFSNKIYQKKMDFDKLITNYNTDVDRYQTLIKAVEVQFELSNALKLDYQSGLVGISDYLNAVSQLLQKKQQRDRLFVEQLKRLSEIENTLLASEEKR